MSVVVVGLEHQQAPLELLERIAVSDLDAPKVLGTLRDCANLQEAVLLSTCLRTEVYMVVDRFHDGVAEAQQVLADRSGLTVTDLEPHFQVRFDDDVAHHLFAVASGLESVVPGESEVLGQVRRAWERSRHEGVTGPVLSGLFRHAVQTGKRVRSETAIARGTTSFSFAAVELAESRLAGGLAGGVVTVVGAGEMGAGLVAALLGRPIGRRPAEIVVVNRSADHAESVVTSSASAANGSPALAGATSVRAAQLEHVASELALSALVFAAVEADGPVLGLEHVAPSGDRSQSPVLVVDLGVPRNVDAAVGHLPGVTLLDMSDLRASVNQVMDDRHAEVDAARQIIGEELTRYRAASRARGAAPVVAALRARLEQLRVAELERRQAQDGDLSPAAWEQVDEITRSVLAKLVHEPTVQLKETAGTPRGERLVEALRSLFDL